MSQSKLSAALNPALKSQVLSNMERGPELSEKAKDRIMDELLRFRGQEFARHNKIAKQKGISEESLREASRDLSRQLLSRQQLDVDFRHIARRSAPVRCLSVGLTTSSWYSAPYRLQSMAHGAWHSGTRT